MATVISEEYMKTNGYISTWKRIVLKIGSALIAPDGKGCSSHNLLAIAQFIIECRKRHIDVILVSSGSVAAGRSFFKEAKPSIGLKKAMAAAGQAEMLATWDRLFDFPTAQVLLTHGDLTDKERYDSIKETISTLLENGLLPIINENDTVTTDYLKVGDNDNLSAMVAAATHADVLIMCSDIEGLFTKDPNKYDDAVIVKTVNEIDDDIKSMAGCATSSVGTGGMATKLEAAEKAAAHGIYSYIVNGFNLSVFTDFLIGKNPGTLFAPYAKPLDQDIHWLTHTTREQGELVLNKEGADAFILGDTALSTDDVVEVNGNFSNGDTVIIKDSEGEELAKASTNYSSCLLSYIADISDKSSSNSVSSVLQEDNIAMLNEASEDGR